MKCRLFSQWVVAGLLALVSAGKTHAEPTYAYRFDQSDYTVFAGATVDVRVFLVETLGAGDTSILATEGLFSAGTRVVFSEAAPAAPAAMVLDVADILGNPAFDFPLGPLRSLSPGVSAGLVENVSLSNPTGVMATGGPTTFETFLGTFRFTAGDVGNELTLLRATDFSPGAETITNLTGTALDARISDARATITVIPEPATVVLLALAVLVLLTSGLRHRRTRHISR
jgi:hypothetical protein